jgi:ParB/RepB/Spo0J family partition protein
MLKEIAIKDMNPCPWNPREITEESVKELAESIKADGLLQPLLVRPSGLGGLDRFEVVAGHRRLMASQLVGLKKLPCQVRVLSDDEVLRFLIVENLERSELTLFEEAKGVRALAEATGEKVADVAKMLHRGQQWVQLRLDLFELPPSALAAVRSGKMGVGVAGMLARVPDDCRAMACSAAMELLEDGINGEVIEGMIHADYLAVASFREGWLRNVGRFTKEAGLLYKGLRLEAVADPVAAWEELFYSFGQLRGEFIELPKGWPSHKLRATQEALRGGAELEALAREYQVRCVIAPAWQETGEYVVVVDGEQLESAIRAGGLEEGTQGTQGTDLTDPTDHEDDESEPTDDDDHEAALKELAGMVEWVEGCDDSERFALAVDHWKVDLPKFAILVALHAAADAVSALKEDGE